MLPWARRPHPCRRRLPRIIMMDAPSGMAARAAPPSTGEPNMTSIPQPGLAAEVQALLAQLGVAPSRYLDGFLPARSAVSGTVVARLQETAADQGRQAIAEAHQAFLQWRLVPAPKRGE